MVGSAARSTCERALAVALAAHLAIGATLCARPARAAGGDDARAAELKSRGDADMDSGAYADAITSYRAGYELTRNPALLYNIGTAYEQLGDYPQALAYLDEFARIAAPELRARVPALGRVLEDVRAHVSRLRIACDVTGARVMVRGVWRGTTPLPEDIVLSPGAARVDVYADGHVPSHQDVDLVAGRVTVVRAALREDARPIARETAPDEASHPLLTRWWFWTGVGVVVLGGVAVAIAATRERGAPSGDIGPGQVSAPLVRW